jgi:hypothetical protein
MLLKLDGVDFLKSFGYSMKRLPEMNSTDITTFTKVTALSHIIPVHISTLLL